MKRRQLTFMQRIFLAVLALSLFGGVPSTFGQLELSGIEPVNVGVSSFSVVWQTSQTTEPDVAIFTDANGDQEITEQLRVEIYPVHVGDVTVEDDLQGRENRRSLESAIRNRNLVLARVSGCEPGTAYSVKPQAFDADGNEITPPGTGLLEVTTAARSGFVTQGRQLVFELTGIDAYGMIATLSTGEAAYPIASVVGDGPDPNKVYFNLSQFLSTDGTTLADFSGSVDLSLELLGGTTDYQATRHQIDYGSDFLIAQSTSQSIEPQSPVEGYEGDVAPRPDGDGTGRITITDWVQSGRYVVKLDPIESDAAFQRADTAPRMVDGQLALGDGRIAITDWVQTGRYSVGLDPVQEAGGPSRPSGSGAGLASGTGDAAADERPYRLSSSSGATGATPPSRSLTATPVATKHGTVAVPVVLQSGGHVNAISFTLDFDPGRLSYRELIRTGAEDAFVVMNSRDVGQGRLAVVISKPSGGGFAAGELELAQIVFDAESADGPVTLSFNDGLALRAMADSQARLLPASFRSLNLQIDPESGPRLGISQGSTSEANVTATHKPGSAVTLETSTDLVDWTPLRSTQVPSDGRIRIPIELDQDDGARFYRIRLAPKTQEK